MELNIKSSGVYYSLHEWYYSNRKAERIPYEIFTYWSEDGGLDKLFSKLGVKEANVGESFYFEFDSKNELGCERDLIGDFKTQTFKVINLRHEYLSDGNGEFEFCKLYNLEPHIK